MDEATWLWYNDVVGSKRCTVVDTYWQTGESGWIMFGSPVFDVRGGKGGGGGTGGPPPPPLFFSLFFFTSTIFFIAQAILVPDKNSQ